MTNTIKLTTRYALKAMPDYSGIAFFDCVSGETSFYCHPSLSLLVFSANKVDWVASQEKSLIEANVQEIIDELTECGYLEVVLSDH